jgi:hypothetical protein
MENLTRINSINGKEMQRVILEIKENVGIVTINNPPFY